MFEREQPGFNKPAAEIIFKAIMGLDADEAVVFSTMLLGATLASDLMVHGGAVGRQLRHEATGRTEVMKRELARTAIAKARNGDNADPELRAIVALSKALQLPGGITLNFGHANGGDGDAHADRVRRAQKQLRDLQTGEFIQEHIDIAHDDTLNPTDAMAAKHGIAPARFDNLTQVQRAQFFNSYAQAGALVEPYQRLPKGQAYAHIIRENGPAGGQLVDIAPNAKLDPNLFNPKHEDGKVVAVKVSKVPDTDAPGATFDVLRAFGASGATAAHGAGQLNGGILDPKTIAAFGQATQGQASDEFIPSQKVFRRLVAGSNLLNATLGSAAPPQAKMAMSVARHVGTFGPEAQKVIGPVADRAAYRYRGTERKPDAALVNAFGEAQTEAARRSGEAVGSQSVRDVVTARDRQLGANRVSFSERQGEVLRSVTRANDQRRAGTISRAQHKTILRDAKIEDAASRNRLKVADKKVNDEFTGNRDAAVKAQRGAGAAKAQIADNIAMTGIATKDGGWSAGPVLNYFASRVPSTSLSDLQLKSGVTPPSEGVIIDKNGRLAHQAVGYGDDHYLPFNLKNLRSLRGGEYIRTRTYGGPTTEDIYTGLITGARRLTVVSNSGVYTVTFDPTFHGGRRYNDKAARMVGRYAHLLDALNDGNVASEAMDPSMRRQLRGQAQQMFGEDTARQNEAYTQLVARQMANPKLSDEQLQTAATEWLSSPSVVNTHGETMTPEQALRASAAQDAKAQHEAMVATYRANVSAHGEELRRYEANAPFRQQWQLDRPDDLDHPSFAPPVAPQPPPSVEVITQSLIGRLDAQDPLEHAKTVAQMTNNGAGFEAFLRTKERENRERTMQLRLNGPGYLAALKALAEQFPYYFQKPIYHPSSNAGADDSGYVKPKYLRPTNAVAGYFGHGTNTPAETAKLGTRTAQAAAPAERSRSAEQATAPAAPQASTAAQTQADQALLEHLLAVGDRPAGEGNGLGLEPTNTIRGAIQNAPNDAAVPDALKFLYGTKSAPREPELVRREVAANPAARQQMYATADFLAGKVPLDERVVAAARGGESIPVRRGDIATMLAKPNANYDWAPTLGDAYAPSPTLTPERVEAAWKRNDDIMRMQNQGMLASLDAEDFDDISRQLQGHLTNQHTALQKWETESGGMGSGAPVDREVLERDVSGMVQANQLHRRYVEAVTNSEASRRDAMPNVTAVYAPDFSSWSPQQLADFARLSPEDRQAALQAAQQLAGAQTRSPYATDTVIQQ